MKLDLVDVFCKGPLSGNPLAVVHGAGDLSAEAMLAITRWLGFSETTFLLPPSDPAADYRVRIFYPAGELPFAGHPTLGTCHAWLAAGGQPRQPGQIIQECGIGLVEIRQDAGRLAFRAPPMTRTGPLSEEDRAEVLRVTGANPEAVVEAVHVANGPQWRLLRLASSADLLAAEPVSRATPGTDVGLLAQAPAGSGAEWELRAFFADGQGRVVEDPVTGSLNAGVAVHLFTSGLAHGSYVAVQGRKAGADGEVLCSQSADGAVWIGGQVRTVSAGGAMPGFTGI